MMPAALKKVFCSFQVLILAFTSLILPAPLYAQSLTHPALTLPAVGESLSVSQAFTPVLIKGLTIDESDPLKFEFLMDQGDADLEGEELKSESYKLIKYFMASLTVPEKDLWVNLSPYEKDRIIPDSLGQTEMGRDLLSQDYILKQLTATLMSPQGETGKRMWERIYQSVYESQDRNDAASQETVNAAVNAFNKIWIVPQTGYFYEHNNSVLITDARLKVMLEEDYVAAQKSSGLQEFGLNSRNITSGMVHSEEVKQIIREVIIPVIEQEVNEGANFAPLRQVYNAMLLAVWFKKRIKDHFLSAVYVDQRKVNGIDFNSPDVNEMIWKRYVETFESGVAGVIQEEYDAASQSTIPRKYFVGGTLPLNSIAGADDASLTGIKLFTMFINFVGRPHSARIMRATGNFMLAALITLFLTFQSFSNPGEQSLTKEKNVGGVNLRADQADLRIQKDENGFRVPKYDPTMPMMPLQRLTPVIMDLKFISIRDAALKLGLNPPQENLNEGAHLPTKARQFDQLSSL